MTADVPDTDRDQGDLVLAGVVLILVGVLSVIEGVAALAGSGALADAELVVGGSSQWGTTLIVLGGASGLIAVSLWAGAGVRWIAVGIAALSGIAEVLLMPAYPFWSMAVFALDVLVIYTLVAGVPGERGGTR
jgi:hypothetical protein